MVYSSSPVSPCTEPSSQTVVESPPVEPALYLPVDCLPSKLSGTSNSTSEETQSDKYWFEDGTIVFKAENTLYKVYKGIFIRQSGPLASVMNPPVIIPIISKGGKGKKKGSGLVRREPPCPAGIRLEEDRVLLDIAESDFELLLSYMFPHDYERQYSFSAHEWSAIANAAKKLELKSIVAVATSKVFQTADALELIDIGRKHDNHACYLEGFRRLCTRESSLTIDEGLKLGVECLVSISQARDRLAKGMKWSELEDLVRFRDGVEAKAKDEMLKATENAVAAAEERATEAEARAMAMARVRLEARDNAAEEAAARSRSPAAGAVEINSSAASPVPKEEFELVEAVSSQSELRQHNEPWSTWGNGLARRNGVDRFSFGAAHKKAGRGWSDF